MIGAGTAGLSYLMFRGAQLQREMYLHPAKQMGYFDPLVQSRIKNTLMYFGTGLAGTGLLVNLMRNSMFAINHPFMLLFGSLGLLFGTMMTDYHRMPALKHFLWGGFMGVTALGMVPLIQMASLPIIYDALFATGLTMGGLGLVALNAPSE